jgi:xylan 1,4-beta-xylosidase
MILMGWTLALTLAAAQGRRGDPQPTRAPDAAVTMTIDTTAEGWPLIRPWAFFGYDEPNFSTSTLARQLMKTLATIDPQRPTYLRCHFLLCTNEGQPALKWGATDVYREDGNGNPIYDFRMIDEIVAAQVDSGCIPLIDLMGMPKALSTDPEPYRDANPGASNLGWQAPPKDYDKWAGLIKAVATHFKQKYPDAETTWMWELWNEPDIFYWSGTPEEYMQLYDVTEKAIHEAMPNATFGGPHSAFTSGDTFRPFLNHVLSGDNYATPGRKGTRVDYIAYHSKGNTAMYPPRRGGRGRRGQADQDAAATPTPTPTPAVEQHIQMNMGQNINAVTNGFRIVAGIPELKDKPIVIGEMDPEGVAARSARDYPPNSYRQSNVYPSYQASMILHAIRTARAHGVTLKGTLSWAFMFDGYDTFEGYRTLSTNGIEKPLLNGFRVLGMLKGREVPVTSSGALDADLFVASRANFRGDADIDAFATAGDSGAQAVVWNYHDDLVEVPAAPITLTFVAPPGKSGQARVTHWRIDRTHSNSYTVWQSMGSPNEITPPLAERINNASKLTTLEEPREYPIVNGRLTLRFDLPRHALSLVEVSWP